jgi:hypothetical protein
MPSTAVSKLRAQVARRTQSYPSDHPRVVEARQELDYTVLAEHAARVVANWPQPTPEQLQKVAAILRASVNHGGDA